MPGFADEPLTKLAFSIHQNPGVYALLLGSGISSAAGIPTGWSVTLDLIRRVGMLEGVGDQSDWAAWYRARTGRAPDYSDLLAELGATQAERQRIVAGYIEPTEEDREESRKLPTAAHHAIARLVAGGYVRVIVTTNFDRLLESALRDAGVEPVVIASPGHCQGAPPLQHSRCTVIKVHGDYLDPHSLNTAEELRAYDPAIDRLLDRIFDEYGLVIAGWSGVWDIALRAAIGRAPGRRYSTWWTTMGQLADLAQDLANRRGAITVPIRDADACFSGLAVRVSMIEEAKRPHPDGIQMLLAGTKRYLARPEHRIALADLIDAETRRLVAETDGDGYPTNVSLDSPAFRERAIRYEAATEPLACMLGLVGRWGDESADRIARECLIQLYKAAMARRGGGAMEKTMHLRYYPALLCLYAYGVGLTFAERWQSLRRVFAIPVVNGRNRDRKLAEVMFLDNLPRHNPDYWRWDSETRWILPLSHRLKEIVQAWQPSFTGMMAEPSLTLDRFEIRGSLACFSMLDMQNVQQILGNRDDGRNYIRVPVGTAVHDEDLAEKLLAELVSGEKVPDVDFEWDPTILTTFDLNYRRLINRIDWM